jgi:two-component system cell cycle sensor histidine kinase/response regulator CckA
MVKAHILLAEDNPMVRRSIEATLRGSGYRVTAVGSGEQCVQAVERTDEPVDLLITDVMMPRMSGREIYQRVHALAPGLPVLYMSGYDRSTLTGWKQAVATEHFLQKPFDCEELLAAVIKAMTTKDQASGPTEG